MTSTPPFILAPRRVHEAGGPGAQVFAVAQAMDTPGTVAWIRPAHLHHALMPGGLPAGLAERLLLIRPEGETDLLWAVEEALRAPSVTLVVAEPVKPMSLTAGRRLQLAAEAGGTTGLILIREGAGSNTAETRWHCAPFTDPSTPPHAATDSTLHQWSLIKNKKGTNGYWRVSFDVAAHSVRLVSKVAE